MGVDAGQCDLFLSVAGGALQKCKDCNHCVSIEHVSSRTYSIIQCPRDSICYGVLNLVTSHSYNVESK